MKKKYFFLIFAGYIALAGNSLSGCFPVPCNGFCGWENFKIELHSPSGFGKGNYLIWIKLDSNDYECRFRLEQASLGKTFPRIHMDLCQAGPYGIDIDDKIMYISFTNEKKFSVIEFLVLHENTSLAAQTIKPEYRTVEGCGGPCHYADAVVVNLN